MNASTETDGGGGGWTACVWGRGWGCWQPIDSGHICDAGTDRKEVVFNYWFLEWNQTPWGRERSVCVSRANDVFVCVWDTGGAWSIWGCSYHIISHSFIVRPQVCVHQTRLTTEEDRPVVSVTVCCIFAMATHCSTLVISSSCSNKVSIEGKWKHVALNSIWAKHTDCPLSMWSKPKYLVPKC